MNKVVALYLVTSIIINSTFCSTKPSIPTEVQLKMGKHMDIECIMQYPELPNGCEVTSLATVFNYYDVKVDKCDLADNYLKQGEIGKTDPNEAFIGNPRYNYSYGCNASVIYDCAKEYIKANKLTDYEAINITNADFKELIKYVDKEIPIIVWVTSNLAEPYTYREWNVDGKDIVWTSPFHCVVLTGYNVTDNIVYVSDPQIGNTKYDLDMFKQRYEQLGSQAVIITLKGNK